MIMPKKFVIFGDGRQAQRNKKAIAEIGGEILIIYDPPKYGFENRLLVADKLNIADWVIIASPNYLHYQQVKYALSYKVDVIVEKPSRLPWEPVIDDDKVNIILPFNYLDDLPDKADRIKVIMVRDDKYYKTWQGDHKKTGGIFFHLFVHYIDLAIRLKANFDGRVWSSGEQERTVDKYDLMNIDYEKLYAKMYEEIIFKKGGIKPKDKFFLDWIMGQHCSPGSRHRYGTIRIDKDKW